MDSRVAVKVKIYPAFCNSEWHTAPAIVGPASTLLMAIIPMPPALYFIKLLWERGVYMLI